MGRKARLRGAFAAGACSLLLAGCADDQQAGLLVSVEGFAGVVAADEPNATVVGRDVLGNNGSAADAAVAMAMTMAVTLPSRVGLGGGGACLVWSDEDGLADALLFPPVRAADGAVPPLLTRAMALLHARYGTLRWEELVAPAENFARFGFITSRAFARDVAAAQSRLAGDPQLAALFQDESGDWIEEGRRLRNPELSSVLGGVRAQGGGHLHRPSFARRYADAAAQAGVAMNPAEIRDARAEFLAPVEIPVGDSLLLLPPPRSSAGVAAGQMWRMLQQANWIDAAPARQARLTAEAGLKALAARRVWIGPDGLPIADPQVLVSGDSVREMVSAPLPPATSSAAPPFAAGFVTGDRRGNAVACSFTLNDLFGRGRLADGLGLVLPAAPVEASNNSVPLAVALIADPETGRLDEAVSASGGEAAFQHLVQVLQRMTEGQAEARAALDAPRLVWQGGRILAEPGIEAAEVTGTFGGVPLLRQSDGGLVNAFSCPMGLRQDDEAACTVATDPRGLGLAERAQ
ncbi:gamma-glutamyltransferase [Algihabitans albus]|uniref:gamma-glutamyltransferase n=1 Tax=Algihabitans albus TaxID=2164067 RepID=UPI0013C332D2|nr:gamma-glutamyltransferase [Algihabitans albus]